MKRLAIVIAAVASVSVASIYYLASSDEPPDIDAGSYELLNSQIREGLEGTDVSISSPINIRGSLISQYCDFFDDPRQDDILYCTSTELKDGDGGFLGNIHTVGGARPDLVIAVVQTDHAMGRLDSVKSVFESVTDTLVCDCWEEQAPDDLPTLGHWVQAHGDLHLGDDRQHSRSEATLEGHTLQMQLDTDPDGYVWHLILKP